MDDPRVFRMLTIGLVLTAIAVGYFLLSGQFAKREEQNQTQVNQTAPEPVPVISTTPAPEVSPEPSPTKSAYETIAERSKGGVQTLPNTGFPLGLTLVFSAAAIAAGWGLRKFPH